MLAAPAGRAREKSFILAEEALEAPLAAAPEFMEEESISKVDLSLEGSTTSTERIVIKNANISIVVSDPVKAVGTIMNMAEDMGGFVVNSNVYKTTTSSGIEVPIANVTVRVPAEKLNQALDSIKSLVEDETLDILSEDISGQDVTSEVTDLESRLHNLQEAEQQLLEIMDDAEETEDVMSVFHELTYIREQIEVLQGQIKYYRESARLSAVSVYIQAKEAVTSLTIGGWQPSVEVQKALQALINGLKYLANFLIWLVIFLAPFAAIIGLPIYFFLKVIRKRHKKSKVKEEIKPKMKK
jgi:hypothetical protein